MQFSLILTKYTIGLQTQFFARFCLRSTFFDRIREKLYQMQNARKRNRTTTTDKENEFGYIAR